MGKEILYAENLVTDRSYGQNLDYISFSLNRGEAFGMTALNGDGLTTLADVLTGRLQPSGGRIFIDGQQVTIDSRAKAEQLGIWEIRENGSLLPRMSAAENLSLPPSVSGRSLIRSPKKNEKTAREILEHYGVRCDPEMTVQKLSYLQRTELLICRALLRKARILICSEAGAGFSEKDQKEFEEFLERVREEGTALLLMNSDARTTLRFAGRVAVMRGGMICYYREDGKARYQEILRHMVFWRKPLNIPPSDTKKQKNEMLLQQIRPRKKGNKEITLALQGGSTSGLLWNLKDGEDTVYRMFSGLLPARGTVSENGRRRRFSSWRRENAAGIVCLRKQFWSEGLYENMTVAENIALRTFRRFGYRGGVINANILRLALEEFCGAHEIDPGCLSRSPRHLDWEFRNKIVLLGLLFEPPKLLVLDHPFYAIDEETKQNLLHCIERLKNCGTAVLWCSSEETMLHDFCDTVSQAL